MLRALVLVLTLALPLLAACNRSQADAPRAPATPSAPAANSATAPGGAQAIPITVGRAEVRRVQRAVETSGSLVAWEEIQAKSEQPGTITRLRVDLGDRVARGAVLADYDRREFDLAVEQAEADLSAARESLARARATALASAAALRRTQDNLSSLQAEVARAQSQVEWTATEMERTRQLFAKELIASRDVDNARNLHNIAGAQLAVTKAALDQHPDQVRVAEAQLQSDQAAVKTAEAQVRQREASRGIMQKRLGDTTVRATIDGYVARRHISAGEYVKENTPLFTLVIPNPLKYVGNVPERHAPELRITQTVRLTVEAHPGKTFTGSLLRVAPAVDVATRTLALEARVPNPDGLLRPGFFAKGAVLTREDANVVVVPADALMVVAGLNKIFVVANGKAEERLVRPGSRHDQWLEIDVVKVGEAVATSNLPSLYNGAPVAVTAK